MPPSASGWHRYLGRERHPSRALALKWVHDNGARIFQGWEYRPERRRPSFVYVLAVHGVEDREFFMLRGAKVTGSGVNAG